MLRRQTRQWIGADAEALDRRHPALDQSRTMSVANAMRAI